MLVQVGVANGFSVGVSDGVLVGLLVTVFVSTSVGVSVLTAVKVKVGVAVKEREGFCPGTVEGAGVFDWAHKAGAIRRNNISMQYINLNVLTSKMDRLFVSVVT